MGCILKDRMILAEQDRSLLNEVRKLTGLNTNQKDVLKKCGEHLQQHEILNLDQRSNLKLILQPIDRPKNFRNRITETTPYDDYKDSYD